MENQKFEYTKGVSVGENSENGEEGIISKLMQETFSAQAINQQFERTHRVPGRRMTTEPHPGG